METLCWYALQCQPNQEAALWQFLRAECIEAYYPRFPSHTLNPRAPRVQPFFPGTLFVHVDPAIQWPMRFQRMPGALGLVYCGEKPAPVPESIIHDTQAAITRLLQGNRESTAGSDVPVGSSYQPIFDTRLPAADRARALLQLLCPLMAASAEESVSISELLDRR